MTKFLIVFLFPFWIYAQKHTERIGGGIEYMVGDHWFISPHLTYEYQVGKRTFFTSNLGFIHKRPKYNVADGYVFATLQRIMLDFDAKFAILKFKNNYLKIGVGPSLWFKNETFPSIREDRLVNNPFVDPMYFKKDYENKNKKGVNVGYNISSELDIRVSKKLSLITKLEIIEIKNVGLDSFNSYPSIALGISGLYKIK